MAYTGMRDDEAATLPYHCHTTSVSNGRTHYLVEGRTTKFNGGLPKRTRWGTNYEAVKAIQIAQAIADSIYRLHAATPSTEASRLDDCPLFVSVLHMRCAGRPPAQGRFTAGKQGHRELPRSSLAIIEENDLRELEQVDLHRNWRVEENFQIGRRWHFTNHQLRRSLALYAQRSGLVSLPSLRRQLQHITEEMARYYARGSLSAKNFIGDDKRHFGREWQSTQPESAALSYFLNVLLTDETLFGGHATWSKHRIKGPDGTILVDRADTLKRFKKGELAYRETLIGGCTSVTRCDKAAIEWLHVECLRDNCKNLVCNVGKLDRVIAAQQRLVDSLPADLIEYKVEKADLNVLIESRNKAVGEKKGTAHE